ncbi:MAG: zonular occludens toxin domain-containing protein [Planctomycetia bacterium]|nr:zonular occludens toxin domain-containing protein [Planctomycetia bacterium]
MALSLIIGKPGSGKTYFAVSKIADFLCDVARYELKNKIRFERNIYTNLLLNIEKINEYCSKHVGESVDLSSHIIFLDDEFFFDVGSDGVRHQKLWWEEIEDGAFIVVDEVHRFIPSGTVKGRSADWIQVFSEYIAQHRHRRQDLLFITQHTDTLHKNVLCFAESACHICNVKTRVIPFLRIPFADFDVVKEAFGIKNQVANVIYGNYLSRSFKFESETTIVLLQSIFALYKSHTMSDEESDRPSLNLSRVGAILWFLRRHFWHLALKLGACAFVLYLVYFVLAEGPSYFSRTLVGSMTPDVKSKSTEAKSVSDVKNRSLPAKSVQRVDEARGGEKAVEHEKEDIRKSWYKDKRVFVFGRDFVVMDIGRVAVGESFERDGLVYVLESVDCRCKKVSFHLLSAEPVRVQAAGQDLGSVFDSVREDSGKGGKTE